MQSGSWLYYDKDPSSTARDCSGTAPARHLRARHSSAREGGGHETLGSVVSAPACAEASRTPPSRAPPQGRVRGRGWQAHAKAAGSRSPPRQCACNGGGRGRGSRRTRSFPGPDTPSAAQFHLVRCTRLPGRRPPCASAANGRAPLSAEAGRALQRAAASVVWAWGRALGRHGSDHSSLCLWSAARSLASADSSAAVLLAFALAV